VLPETFMSKKVKGVHVLGDAAAAAEMPKSAFAANSQAKVVAADILAELAKKERFPARFRNTCWSMLGPDDAVKIGANYVPVDGRLDPSGSFISRPGETAAIRQQQHDEGNAWFDAIVTDMFAQPPNAGETSSSNSGSSSTKKK
jgi:sulfide dehydrogenase [flavocytochrome c] flavoprotein chain